MVFIACMREEPAGMGYSHVCLKLLTLAPLQVVHAANEEACSDEYNARAALQAAHQEDKEKRRKSSESPKLKSVWPFGLLRGL